MVYFFFFFLFVLGTAFGSFLNVLIWRYRPERGVFSAASVGGRSRCPNCSKKLGALELIPLLSFLIQSGRCLNCRRPLSLQYPLVEFLSGAIFLIVPLFLNNFYGASETLFFAGKLAAWYYVFVSVWILTFLTWLVIAAIDLREYLIPDELNAILAILGAAAVFILIFKQNGFLFFNESFLKEYAFLFSFSRSVILNHVLGAFSVSVLFAALVFGGRGRVMGFGDVKLALASGFLLGWPDIGLAAVLSFVFGGLFGSALILLRKKTLKDAIPFAPFFVAGMAVTVFWGRDLLNLYFKLFQA